MPNMKYKYIHECRKPDMIVGQKKWTTGHWFWKKHHERNIYDKRQVVWDCFCGAKWSWLGSFDGSRGFWMCDYRPDVWKKMKEDA